MNLLKKIFTVGVVTSTILWSVGVSALVPVMAQAATCPEWKAGMQVKVVGKAAVYVLDAKLATRYYADGDVFKSWNTSEQYTGITEVSLDCFKTLSAPASFPFSVNFRAGVNIVKHPVFDTLYVVEPNNVLAPISAAAAKVLYPNYKVKTIGLSEWPAYTLSSNTITEAVAHAGMLVKVGATTYYINENGQKQEVTAAGMVANRFKAARVLGESAIAGLSNGASIDFEVAALTARVGENNAVATTPATTVGALTVSLAANTPAAQDVPENVNVEFLKLNLTASSQADVNVTGLKLSAAGLGTYSEIDAVTVYADGVRYGNSRDVDSNKMAQINFTTPLVVAKGTTKTVVVKASVAGTGKYALQVAASTDVLASSSVGGSYPIVGNTMAGNSVTVGTLTIDDDATSLSNVKLGDMAATVAKFRVDNSNIEDVTLSSITLKKDSTNTTVAESDFTNFGLYLDGALVASTPSLSNKYVVFNLTNPVTIVKNGVRRFTVKADVAGGAGKVLQLLLDTTADAGATGQYYHYPVIITNTYAGATVTITAGAVTVEKVNALNVKIKKDTKDVEFGSFKVTVNSGKTVELSTLRLTAASTNDAAGTQIENVEVYLKNTNTVYDLTSSTGNGVYRNTSMGLVLNSGVTYEFVVRADTKSSATNGDYTWSIANAGTDLIMKETGNDSTVTDITPNSVALNKVSVETASVTFSKNALSAAYNAVVGTSNVEVFNFNVKAGDASDVKLTQLVFADNADGNTITKSQLSEFKLYKGTDLVKTVSANELSSQAITFSDLNQTISAGQAATFKLTTSLVKDVNNNGVTTTWGMTGYSTEETNKGTAVYDAAIDPATSDGIVAAGTFQSARIVTIVGYGSLNVSVDNTVAATKYDTNVLAGSEGVAVGTYKFKATNEGVKVTQLKIVSSGSLANAVSKYTLWDGNTKVSESQTIGANTTTMDDDFTVTGEKFLTLKVNLQKIGQDQPGQLDLSSTFRLGDVTAEGVDSGFTLVAGDPALSGKVGAESSATAQQTAVSKTLNIMASNISSVALKQSASSVSLASKIYNGIGANAAIIELVVPQTSNTNSDGTALKFQLVSTTLALEKSGVVTNFSATIERIGGSNGTTATFSTSSSAINFALPDVADYKFNPGETVYLLVRVTPYLTSSTYAGDASIKVTLPTLNGTAFRFLDRSDATPKTSLNIPGITTVDGYTLSN